MPDDWAKLAYYGWQDAIDRVSAMSWSEREAFAAKYHLRRNTLEYPTGWSVTTARKVHKALAQERQETAPK
jgi:hypothetical protein